jgi:hypothetical protein
MRVRRTRKAVKRAKSRPTGAALLFATSSSGYGARGLLKCAHRAP